MRGAGLYCGSLMPSRVRSFARPCSAWPHATLLVVAIVACLGTRAAAQDRGFRLHRFEGTAAGTSQFLVERPWYSEERTFAVGLTLDGSQDPLVPRLQTGRGAIAPIISQAAVGHFDLAVSIFDRVLLAASLPVTLLERGTTEVVSQVGPVSAASLGDPRLSVMLRLVGRADRDPVSVHLGADAWLPIGAQDTHQGDGGGPLSAARGQTSRYTLSGAWGVRAVRRLASWGRAFEGGSRCRWTLGASPPGPACGLRVVMVEW